MKGMAYLVFLWVAAGTSDEVEEKLSVCRRDEYLLLATGGTHKPQGQRVPEGVAQSPYLHNSPHYLRVSKTPKDVPTPCLVSGCRAQGKPRY